MKHRQTHPVSVPGCYGCKLIDTNIGAFPTDGSARERRWDRDMPAYKRLRDEGVQPKAIDGCADLETRAHDQFEIEMGHIVPKEARSRVIEGMEISKELNLTGAAGA